MSNAFSICKITSLLLALTLVVVPFCSYADDESAADPVQGSAPLSFTLDEWEFISQAFDEDDRQLRQASVLTATATTYDFDDIYSILSSVRTIENSRYVWSTFDESVWSEVHNVYNKLITNSYNNTYYSISELVAQLLIQFNSFSSFFYSPISGSPSLWQLSDDIKTFVGLGLFDSQANSYLDLINSKIGSLSSSMTSGFNAVLTRQGQLLSSVDSLRSDVQGTTSSVNNTTNSVNNVVSSVDSLKSDLNSVSWSTLDSSLLGVKTSLSDSDFLSSSAVLSDSFYVFYSFNANIMNDNNVYRFRVPIRRNSTDLKGVISDLKVLLSNGSELSFSDYYYTYHTYSGSFEVYFNDLILPRSGSTIILFVKLSSTNNRVVSLNSSAIDYIKNSESDYYIVYDYIFKHNLHQVLGKFEQLYASDDLIQSKQNQQGLEDQVLDDFTGSGSASAKVADAVDVKGVQGQVLGALGSSASASDLTTIFNTSNPGSDNSFFSFFTQRVYNDLNNVQSTRGPVLEDDVYINLLDQRNDEYINLLGGTW